MVSRLTPNSAANTRRLRLLELIQMISSWSDESLRRRGDWYDARRDRPLTRRGGTVAKEIGSVPRWPWRGGDTNPYRTRDLRLDKLSRFHSTAWTPVDYVYW